MSEAALHDISGFKISYGIYTVERTPRGAKRRAKWDLHSVAEDRKTAESHARSLAAQPYFNHIEVQEFRVCPVTKKRSVRMIGSYSRRPSLTSVMTGGIAACAVIGITVLMFF